MELPIVHIIIIFSCSSIVLIFLAAIAYTRYIPYRRKREWLFHTKHKYSMIANKESSHPDHLQRIRIWLQTDEAMDSYIIDPKGFKKVYEDKVDEIGEQLIKELAKKYDDEYKSRDQKNTKTV